MRRLAARARDRSKQRRGVITRHGTAFQHSDWRIERPWEVLRSQRRHVGPVRDEDAWGWLGITRDAAWLLPVARGGDPAQFLKTTSRPWAGIRDWARDERTLRWLAMRVVPDSYAEYIYLWSAVCAVAIRDRRSVLVAWAVRRFDAALVEHFGEHLAADRATASRILRRYALARTKSGQPMSRRGLTGDVLGTFAYRHRCERYPAARLGAA